MSADRIDELAATLFAAAREESPDRELLERVQRSTRSGEPGVASGAAASREAAFEGVAPLRTAAPPRPSVRELELERKDGRVRAGPIVGGLLAALVCGGLGLVLLSPRPADTITVSAERSPVEGRVPPRSLPGSGLLPAPATGAAPPGSPEPKALAESEGRGASASRPASSSAEPRSRSRRAASGTSSATSAPGAPSAPAAGELANELGLLKQIRQALRSRDGAGALALLDRYDGGKYGKSLSLEASVLRVEALDAVGRREEAVALARRFVRNNPDSPLAERAQRFVDRAAPARPSPAPQRAP